MNLTQILILAVVQGLTEFLPISSSGHLVIAESLMGVSANATDVNIVLHAGTLLSIVVFYRRRIWSLLEGDRRVIPLLIVATIPAVVLGLAIKTYWEHWLESPLVAGLALPVTGLLLLWGARVDSGGKHARTFGRPGRRYDELTVRDSLVIGLAQALAIVPGISRSGSTIVAGLSAGLKRGDAATFSFLMAIPVIGGAVVLECADLLKSGEVSTPLSLLGLGALVSFVVGLASLSWLIGWIERGRIYYFAYWCIPVGVAILIWQMFFVTGRGIS